MPAAVEPGSGHRAAITFREDHGGSGPAPVCPILLTVLDAHARDRAEVGLALLARLAGPLHARDR
ncbi:hypothetical protein [Saccharothrix algeriensis]|uniref:Uncharacterized protein n=1 Tax=Saccharothrix algeriensis TaxID=173560 RepID=A0A8T8I659_9PSEU|nr:hypothetical protein [Saccharothrix algeriensis]MBM7811626.1 hypothetical protein [Saccharothrix algeriensis]QTR05414.1 hypothetical protein J7S33_12800 [Saccharothrix algeriensis]